MMLNAFSLGKDVNIEGISDFLEGLNFGLAFSAFIISDVLLTYAKLISKLLLSKPSFLSIKPYKLMRLHFHCIHICKPSFS